MRLFGRRPERRSPATDAAATDAAAADASPAPAPARVGISIAAMAAGPFPACSQCGRTDLPIVGGWDPPICQECDAAINEDAMWAEEAGS